MKKSLPTSYSSLAHIPYLRDPGPQSTSWKSQGDIAKPVGHSWVLGKSQEAVQGTCITVSSRGPDAWRTLVGFLAAHCKHGTREKVKCEVMSLLVKATEGRYTWNYITPYSMPPHIQGLTLTVTGFSMPQGEKCRRAATSCGYTSQVQDLNFIFQRQ